MRAIDAPALENPVRVSDWLAMSDDQRADLDGRADSQALLGERVSVLGVSGDWVQVALPEQSTPLDYRGYPGWIPIGQLSAIAPVPSANVATIVVPSVWLVTPGNDPIMEASFGTRLPVYESSGAGDYVSLGLPGSGTAQALASAVVITPANAPALTASGASGVSTAEQFEGLPYLWAGTSGFGFDCSGFVYQVYKAHGVLLPRDAAPQAEMGTPVARSDLAPGDLVFFYADGLVGHVGIYIGNGEMIHSPQTGVPIEISSIDSEPYASSYAGARRVLP